MPSARAGAGQARRSATQARRGGGRLARRRVVGARRPRRDGGLVGGRSFETGGWTHGLPPQSGPSPPTRRLAHRRDRRCRRVLLPRRLAGRRARRAVRPKPSACRSSRLARAGARRQRARPRGRGLGRRTRRDAAAAASPGSTSRPTTASASSERSPATAGATGTDVRGDRPGRSPRSPLERHHAAPSCGRGRRAMAAAPSAPSRCGKRGQQVQRWLERRGRRAVRRRESQRPHKALSRRSEPTSYGF